MYLYLKKSYMNFSIDFSRYIFGSSLEVFGSFLTIFVFN